MVVLLLLSFTVGLHIIILSEYDNSRGEKEDKTYKDKCLNVAVSPITSFERVATFIPQVDYVDEGETND